MSGCLRHTGKDVHSRFSGACRQPRSGQPERSAHVRPVGGPDNSEVLRCSLVIAGTFGGEPECEFRRQFTGQFVVNRVEGGVRFWQLAPDYFGQTLIPGDAPVGLAPPDQVAQDPGGAFRWCSQRQSTARTRRSGPPGSSASSCSADQPSASARARFRRGSGLSPCPPELLSRICVLINCAACWPARMVEVPGAVARRSSVGTWPGDRELCITGL